MPCWNCKYFSYTDYEIDKDGQQQPYGCCTNKDSEDYETEVPDGYECDKYKCK